MRGRNRGTAPAFTILPHVKSNEGGFGRITTMLEYTAVEERHEFVTLSILNEQVKCVDVREGDNSLAQPVGFTISV